MLYGLICLILFVAVVPTQSTSAGTKQKENSVRVKERSVWLAWSPNNHDDDDSILLILDQQPHNHGGDWKRGIVLTCSPANTQLWG